MATPPKKTTPGDSSTSSQSNRPSYADRDLRITKENLYMVLALWMERFPVEQEENMADGSSSEASQEHASGDTSVPPEGNSQNQPEITPKTSPHAEHDSYKKVGAVLVLPNGMIHAVDCSRNGVHGVARLLMAHQDILQDCNVFVSRKPCSLCAKLLVQSKVKRVFFLPIEPEYYVDKEEGENEKSQKDKVTKFENQTSRVDNLFKVSEISQTVFVPRAGKEVLVNTEKKYQTPETIRDEIKKELLGLYWKEDWMANAKYDLPWPAFDDKMKQQVQNDFEGIMEWIASILVEAKKGYVFKAVKALPAHNENLPFNPEGNDHERLQAEHLITLAKFLAERTDDPVTGVGAVIINKEKDIVGLGWNGFPTKALYGEFPRASKKDEATQDKKYPYIIHAEQNALLMRNTKNITGATLFVTKTPCDECTPLIEMQRIKTVVLGEKMKEQTNVDPDISYTKFPKKVRKDVFICFEMESALSAGVDYKPAPTFKRSLNL